jgi:hypothetical protein
MSFTPEALNNFVVSLSSLITTASKEDNIPADFIYLQLQIHSHDIMSWILANSRNMLIESQSKGH